MINSCIEFGLESFLRKYLDVIATITFSFCICWVQPIEKSFL